MASIKLTIDKRSESSKGVPVKIIISHNNRTSLVSTGVSCPIKSFSNGIIKNDKARTARLSKMLIKAQDILFRLEEEKQLPRLSVSEIKKIIEVELKGRMDYHCFLECMTEFISTKKADGTKTVYQTTYNLIEAYDKKATFESMNISWIKKLESYLISQSLSVNYISIHLRNIRAVFNYAIDCEYTNVYPFRKFKIQSEKTRKRNLTPEQMRKLRDFNVEEHQKPYRDMFMLSFYLIGINSADLYDLKHSDVIDGRIEYTRKKTGRQYSIKIEPEAMDIIEHYKGEVYLVNIKERIKDYRNFAKMQNKELKRIGEFKRIGRGGKKEFVPLFPDITVYHARHSWASIAANIDVTKDTISNALGHEIGSDVTSIYINFDNKKVDLANRMVLDELKKAIEEKGTV